MELLVETNLLNGCSFNDAVSSSYGMNSRKRRVAERNGLRYQPGLPEVTEQNQEDPQSRCLDRDSNPDLQTTSYKNYRFSRIACLWRNIASYTVVYTGIMVPAVLYGCETWSLTHIEGGTLSVIENWVLSNLFRPERNKVTGDRRRIHNEELHDLYSSPDIVRVSGQEE
jgi:hypothetical protein